MYNKKLNIKTKKKKKRQESKNLKRVFVHFLFKNKDNH